MPPHSFFCAFCKNTKEINLRLGRVFLIPANVFDTPVYVEVCNICGYDLVTFFKAKYLKGKELIVTLDKYGIEPKG